MRIGQAHLMEYVLLTFFAVLILLLIAFFLTGWQITGAESQKQELVLQKSLFVLKSFSNSPYINRRGFKEGSMFEDSKLTVLKCEDLQNLFGKSWWAEIYIPGYTEICTEENYPNCGYWKFCEKESESIIYEIPVNIYRKVSGNVDIGILRVGVKI